jgi:hypothetical protein
MLGSSRAGQAGALDMLERLMDFSARMTWAVCVVIVGIVWTDGASAQDCLPPPEFKDTPHPVVAPLEHLVSHTEEIIVDRPLAVVLHAVDKPLSETIKRSNSLPGVTGSYMLTEGRYGAPGSRQLNCLSDGSTLVEQVLLREQRIDRVRFRYAVWNYTSSKARPIAYGVGEFTYSAADNGRTHVRWTYSFQLNRHRFPGMLGGLGDYLFRISFLDRSYAAMMRGVLVSTKADSERPAGGG